MNTLLDATDQQTSADRDQPAPEISLGTGTILGIFFGLAVLCAVFFGFGYALGVKRPVPAPVIAAAPAPTGNFNSFKPPPGSPVTPSARPAETVVVPDSPSEPAAGPSAAPDPLPIHTAVISHPAPAAASSTASIVQIAAVSHQEDADLIASTLKRRGYAVLIRREPQDALLHVQLGPFPTKKDAEAMRQRLQADGFNAYIK